MLKKTYLENNENEIIYCAEYNLKEYVEKKMMKMNEIFPPSPRVKKESK